MMSQRLGHLANRAATLPPPLCGGLSARVASYFTDACPGTRSKHPLACGELAAKTSIPNFAHAPTLHDRTSPRNRSLGLAGPLSCARTSLPILQL